MGGFANNAPIVTDGLVFYVDAGNSKSYDGVSGGTTWADLVGGNNGTLTNMETNPASGGYAYDSENGGSIKLDGSNDRVIYQSSIVLNPQPSDAFSVFFWFKYLGNTSKALIANMNASTGYSGWDIWHESSTQLAMHLISSWSSSAIKVRVDKGTENTWNCFGYTYDGSCPTTKTDALNSVNFYWNGIIQTSGKQCTSPNAFSSSTETINYGSQAFEVGSRSGGQIGGSTISNVSFYSRALSDSEILQNYNALKNRFV